MVFLCHGCLPPGDCQALKIEKVANGYMVEYRRPRKDIPRAPVPQAGFEKLGQTYDESNCKENLHVFKTIEELTDFIRGEFGES